MNCPLTLIALILLVSLIACSKEGQPINTNNASTTQVLMLGERAKSIEKKIRNDMVLSESDLEGLSPTELRILRNVNFARHGRKYERPGLGDYFYNQYWYTPREDYKDSDISYNDKANVKLIQAVENRLGVTVPPPNSPASPTPSSTSSTSKETIVIVGIVLCLLVAGTVALSLILKRKRGLTTSGTGQLPTNTQTNMSSDALEMGIFLDAERAFGQEDYPLAEKYYRTALAEAERLDLYNIGIVRVRLGDALKAREKFSEALNLYHVTLQSMEQELGPDHEAVAPVAQRLAEVYKKLNNLPVAQLLLQRALSIHEKAEDPNLRNIAIAMGELAEIFQQQGNSKDAETMYHRALAVAERAYPAEDIMIAVHSGYLGTFYMSQQRFSDAEPFYERTLAIQERIFGASDLQNTAITMAALLLIYNNQNKSWKIDSLKQRFPGFFTQQT